MKYEYSILLYCPKCGKCYHGVTEDLDNVVKLCGECKND